MSQTTLTNGTIPREVNNNTSKALTPGQLPSSAFPLKKFIALPQKGFKIKSGGDQESTTPRKPVPIKAIALPAGLPYCNGEVIEDLTEANNERVQAEHDRLSVGSDSPYIHHRRQPSVSSVASSLDGSVNSFESDGSARRSGRYRKRSSSTPPDIGRQRTSPVDKRIGRLANQYYQTVLNNNKNKNFNVNSGNLSQVNYSRHSNSSDTGISSADTDSDLFDFGDLDDVDLDDIVEPRYSSTPTGLNSSQPVSMTSQFKAVPSGHPTMMQPHYLTLPRNTRLNSETGSLHKADPAIRPTMAYVNGTLPRSGGHHGPALSVYRPRNDQQFIMMGTYPDSVGTLPRNYHGVTDSHNVPDNVVLQPQSSLYKSKAMSASMPTLVGEVSDKEHKKFLKQVKKFEKEEQKRREKEEKRRLKLEKKREKEIKRQEKKYGRTLPRSWGYVNKPIESVYRRPQLSLSAVPIDYEDGAVSSGPPSVRSDGTTITHRTAPPPNSPPPPPQPSVKTRSLYSSAPDLLRLEQVYGGSLRGPPPECNNNNTRKYAAPQNVRHVFHDSIHVSEFAPRSVVLQKGPEGYGFVLRGAKSQTRNTAELDFRPSAEFPALQYLDSVDPGNRSDRAGLKSGDFILEINGENVVRASHDRVVQLIRQSGDTLALKVVTVKPLEKPQHWLQHHDGTMTLPNRSTKKTGKAAPLPPQRDPHTSLSFTKAQGRQIADGMAELEQNGKEISLSTDHLDMVLADYDQHGEQMSISSDQKTASIRSKHSAKRVSCVELEKIENPDAKTSTSTKGKAPAPQPKDYMSPSEMRIKKYHKGKQNGLERSSSTPNLLEGGKKPEPVYATPQIPGDYRRSSNGAINNVYAVPGERPKAPPPPPPGGSSTPTPKRPAPAPPKDSGQVQNVKSEYVSISTERRNSSHTNLNEMSKADKRASEYESSFRPGISAKLTDEPKVQTSSLQQNKLSNRTHSRETSQISVQSYDSAGSKNSEDKPSVSFAEDKVYDSAKSFLQKHPNAHLLVTAEVHDKKSERKPSEPEPDYDAESDDGKNSKLRNSVTIISVGDNNNAKKLTVKSNIPPAESSIVIPPPPSERAPEPPKPASKPTSGNTTPSQHSRQSSASENSEPSKIPPAPPVPPPPPAPPAPPPPPSTGMNSEKTPPLVSENKPKKPLGGLPTNDILAAVEKRKNRMESDGPKMSAGPNKDVQPRNSTEVRNKLIENTQAAILQAVAKRRAKLEQTSETEVADQIESKLSKTKKLQSSKMYFTSDTIQKLDKQEEKKEVKDNKKTEVKSGAIFSSDSISKTKPPSPVASKKTSAVTKPPSPVVEKKVKPPSPVPSKKTKPPSPVVMRKKEASPKKTDIGKGSTEETKVINPKVTDTSKDQNVKVNGDVNGEDFVAMAEKARQDWIKKRSSSSLLLKNKPEIKSKSGDTSKSQTSPKKTSLENKDTPKTNGVMIDSASAKNSKDSPYKKSSAPSSPSKISENKKEIKGITALKSARDTVILAKSTSIRARIANFEQGSKVSEGGKPNPSLDSKVPVYGVTVDSTATETPKSTLPPPPEFGDSVQLEIIPPPTGFNVAEGPDSPSYSAFHHDDSSSVSTLSTLSDDALDGRPKHGYEDLIAPPPPGFDDDSESCDVTNFIPPPPNFGGNVTKNKVNSVSTTSGLNKPFESKSVTSWQCLDVLDWLDSLGLGQYKISFQQKCIDGKKLASLTRNDYMQLGVTQVGHRMNLERSIKKVSARKFHS